MSIHCFILFATVAILFNVIAVLGSPNATAHSTYSHTIATTEDGEERVMPSASIFQKAKSMLTSSDELKHWLDIRTEVDDVFEKMGTYQAWNKLFDNPNLVAWLQYADDFKGKYPGNPDRLIETLRRHYGDEAFLNQVEAAMKDPSTVGIAKKLQEKYLKWELRAERSPREELDTWVLDRTGMEGTVAHDDMKDKIIDGSYNLLANPRYKIWRKYLDRFNRMYPKKKTTVIETLMAYYTTDELLAQMLNLAKKDPCTEKLAANLELELLNAWVRELKEPTEVAKVLNVDDSDALMIAYTRKFNWAMSSAGYKLFDKPQWEAWLKYVDFYKARFPDTKKSRNAILTARYGDKDLAEMIAELKMKLDPDTALLGKQMENAQRLGWLHDRKSPLEVFELLELKKVGDEILASPLFAIWKSYVLLFVKRNPNKKTSALVVLTSVFGDEALAKIVISAKRNRATCVHANSLQRHQLTTWLGDKIAPSVVYTWLKVEGTAADNAERLLYLKYRKDYTLMYPSVRLIDQ